MTEEKTSMQCAAAVFSDTPGGVQTKNSMKMQKVSKCYQKNYGANMAAQPHSSSVQREKWS